MRIGTVLRTFEIWGRIQGYRRCAATQLFDAQVIAVYFIPGLVGFEIFLFKIFILKELHIINFHNLFLVTVPSLFMLRR